MFHPNHAPNEECSAINDNAVCCFSTRKRLQGEQLTVLSVLLMNTVLLCRVRNGVSIKRCCLLAPLLKGVLMTVKEWTRTGHICHDNNNKDPIHLNFSNCLSNFSFGSDFLFSAIKANDEVFHPAE